MEEKAGDTMSTISPGHTVVLSSGVLDSTFVDGDAYLLVKNGGQTYFTTVSSSGIEKIFSGGVAHGTVLSGGSEFVYSSGFATGSIVDSNGDQYILHGGIVSATTINNGGTEFVYSGAAANGTTVNLGGYQIIETSAVASGTVVSAGGEQGVYGGLATATVIDNSGSQSVQGDAFGTLVNGGGFQMVDGGGVASGTTLSDGGFQTVSAGGVASGTVIDSGGEQVLQSGSYYDTTTFNFSSGVGSAVDTVINIGGAIDVAYLPFVSGQDTANIDSTTDVLTLTQSNGTVDFSEQLSGNYAGEYFHLASDGSGGTLITVDTTPCYLRGTRVLTDRGEVPVEDLAIGDRLVTLDGEAKPIRWIGRRRFDGWLAAGNIDIQPICFRAGSIGDQVPARDLLVSPEHAMFLDGALIPARRLVNGVSIFPAAEMEEVEYFHLELARHDVIFAEGAASETFLDDGGRGMFQNVYEYHRLYPEAPRYVEPEYCAPRVEDGYELEAVRRRLNGRAARLAPDGTASPPRALHGHLEQVTRHLIEGWAFEPADPGARLRLAILANDAVIGEVVADRHRTDLAAAGVGDGGHAFAFHLPRGFAPDRAHRVEVRRALDWTPLPGAPKTLAAAAGAPQD